MSKEFIERCQKVVDKYNTIHCQNYKDILFKINKLKNVQEDGFILWLDVKGHLTKLCRAESIPTNPALVEIQINKAFLSELQLDLRDSVICDFSIVHLIVDRLFYTESMTKIFYAQLEKFCGGK